MRPWRRWPWRAPGAQASAVLLVAAVAFALVAATDSPVLPVVTGSVLAGGVTSEMLLGHWFLVDPWLPRWSLRVLTAGAALGLLADAGLVTVQLAVDGNAGDAFLGWAWLALTVMTALLIAGVWFCSTSRRYTGVMAATGLSYLAGPHLVRGHHGGPDDRLRLIARQSAPEARRQPNSGVLTSAM